MNNRHPDFSTVPSTKSYAEYAHKYHFTYSSIQYRVLTADWIPIDYDHVHIQYALAGGGWSGSMAQHSLPVDIVNACKVWLDSDIDMPVAEFVNKATGYKTS